MINEPEIQALVERVARRLDAEKSDEPGVADSGLRELRDALAKIERRLSRIESRLEAEASREAIPTSSAQASPSTSVFTSPWTRPEDDLALARSQRVVHPSQERFGVGEAIAELVDYFEREKICNLEPGNKPCDHCAMCSARGF